MAIDRKYGEVKVERDSERNPVNGTDEPVFVLRVHDDDALTILRTYRGCKANRVRMLARTAEGSDEQEAKDAAAAAAAALKSADDAVAQFSNWAVANPGRMKVAD